MALTIEEFRGALQNPQTAKEIIERLNQGVAQLHQQGKYDEAMNIAPDIRELARQCLGEEHPAFAMSLYNLAGLYTELGRYGAAEQALRQAIDIQRKTVGENHTDFALSLNSLAGLKHTKGDFTTAKTMYEQAVNIFATTCGKHDHRYTSSLNNLACLYLSSGQFVDAESLLQEVIGINRAVIGEQHPDFANNLINLASLYEATERYAAAEPLYQQAIEICLALEHPKLLALSLNGLAGMYESMGDYVTAAERYEMAINLLRSTVGDNHHTFAVVASNLAFLYKSIGKHEAAEVNYQDVIKILQSRVGESPELATAMDNLAQIYHFRRKYNEAEALFRRALELRRKILGERHPIFAQSLQNLGLLYRSTGGVASAESLIRQSLEIQHTTFGGNHSQVALTLGNLALLCAVTSRYVEAMTLMQRAAAINDRMIGQVFSIASENQRLNYLMTLRGNLYGYLSLVVQHLSGNPAAVQSAFDLVLRRKAITTEVAAIPHYAVLEARYPEVASKLQAINALRARIAQKTLAGPGEEGLQAHQRLLSEWNAWKERLEAEVARQVPEMNIEQKLLAIDRQVVAMAMPVGTTLIEFVRFNVLDFETTADWDMSHWKPARYLAFVILAREPETVEMIDLGEAEPIDRLVATFREIITGEEDRSNRGLGVLPSSTRREAIKDVGIELRERIFTPLLKAIGNRKRLMISPDGDLTRLPFEVLPTDDGRRLIDEYKISYLGAGRDGVRFKFKSNRHPARSLVAADPDFDFGARPIRQEAVASVGRRSRDFERGTMEVFDRLPGTKIEGEIIAELLDAELWSESAALDARLKEYRSPRILHLATHGFFLEDQQLDPSEERSGLGAISFSRSGMGRLTGARLENPLLRSGLALAGVNTWLDKGELMEEAEDGLLTAEDVSGLDLLDTELVVLSACETGLGEVRVGEGVFGLRRAFVLAGAKTLVMSLWKVPDEQTRELMEDFYRRILSGEPRADALREAQLAMKAKHPEPFYWGAFICQGDPSPLSRRLGCHV